MKTFLRKISDAFSGTDRFRTVLLSLCVLAVFVSSVLIIRALSQATDAREEYENIRADVVQRLKETDVSEEESGELLPADEEEEAEEPAFPHRPEGAVLEIDFDALHAINPEVVAWLHVPALDLSYPVLQGEDNEYYLTHTAEKNTNPTGAIFMECTNLPDFSHGNTLIYGHNTADGTMFGHLKLFSSDPSLRLSEPFFYVYQQDGVIGKYQIYSYYSVYKESESFSWFTDDESYDYYVALTKELSVEEIDADFSDRGNLVTLATCYGQHGTSFRFLVHGVRTE